MVLQGQGLEADLTRTRAFSASRPVEERPLDDGISPVEGVGSASAETCGACHQEIYAEWSVSTHRHAWNDPQFQAEISKSDSTWLCRNCHTPLRAQQPLWPVGLVDGDVEAPELVPNPVYDQALMQEGVTCAGCHVRDGRIHGPGLPDSKAPHPVTASEQYRSGELCLRCHQAERSYPGKTFVCTFTTGEEWTGSPQHAEGQTCVSCHMPSVSRPAAEGGPVRVVRQHWFKGSGIPKVPDQAPPAHALPGPGLALDLRREGEEVVVRYENRHAGHHLPTGDPERWIQIRATFMDQQGRPIPEPWSERIGQEWRWEPEPQKLSDNRLAPREHRTARLPIPSGAKEIRATAESHRMSQENAVYHQLSDYPLSTRTHAVSLALEPP